MSENSTAAGRISKKSGRISFKLTMLFCAAALLLCIAIGVLVFFESYGAYTDLYSTKVQHIVRTVAGLVDGEAVRRYSETGETDEYYDELLSRFCGIKREMDIQYLYIFVPYEDHFIYILEAFTEKDDLRNIAVFGERYDYAPADYEYLVPDIHSGAASEAKVIERRWDYVNNAEVAAVEAWAPIFTSDGELIAMVEGDLSLEVVYERLTRFLLTMLLLVFLSVLAAVVLLAVRTHLMVTRPLTLITDSARGLVSAENGTASYTSTIKTGDEFQMLGEALEIMSRDIESYAGRIRAVATAEERGATERAVV
ncbi:MAG: hypothetical protein LBJ84_01965, partial [Oscillospiraceae bacterium]|nr:hypothetical protein [Oscillospiraceae bacterium]